MINATIKFQIQEKIEINDEWVITVWKKILIDKNILNGVITIIMSEDEMLRKFKLNFFNQDVLTDVIAFNLEDKGKPIEGEIYISLNRVKENAKEFNEEFINELKRVMIHGCLHLIGHDDDTVEQKEKMTFLENRYLNYMESA
jgi:rRNA maturation RNase YbeY